VVAKLLEVLAAIVLMHVNLFYEIHDFTVTQHSASKVDTAHYLRRQD